MINFIIYEDELIFKEEYIKVIHRVMGSDTSVYKIHHFSSYTENLKNLIENNREKKIYILDIEVPNSKSGIDLARQIRNCHDWTSQIIMVTAHEGLKEGDFRSKVLMLNFISKYDDCYNDLMKSLMLAHEILTYDRQLSIMQEGEIYQFPYDDIQYIEKDLDTEYAVIHTSKDLLSVRQSMISLLKQLDNDPRFIRTHRSCIVNVYNIKSVDFLNSIIKFKNGKTTDLLSRRYKRDLKEHLLVKI